METTKIHYKCYSCNRQCEVIIDTCFHGKLPCIDKYVIKVRKAQHVPLPTWHKVGTIKGIYYKGGH